MSWREHIFCRDFSVEACLWCRRPLNGRKALCCSPTCTAAFSTNHFWSAAAPEALRRAHSTCLRCGRQPFWASRDWTPGAGLREGVNPDDLVRIFLEVHHRVPLLGQPRSMTCYNHQANLLVLCSDCHLETHHPGRLARLEAVAFRQVDRERERQRLAAMQPRLVL